MSGELEVARFASLPEAEAVAALLRHHGIAARLGDGHTTGTMPHLQGALGGARVVVPDHQAYEARELVVRARNGEFAAELGLADDERDDEADADDGRPTGMLGAMRVAAPIIVSLIFLLPVAGCLVLAMG